MRRSPLNEYWPDIVRVAGLVIMFWEAFVEKVDRPSVIVAATGMILFKTVLNGRDKGGDDDREERWSHLP